MEAVALILIAGALFCHSWSILGLYPDGRTMGVYMGAFGVAALIAITFDPMLLIGGDVEALTDAGGFSGDRAYSLASGLAEITMMKLLIVVWAAYAVGVAAQSLWDYDERAIGFYCAVPAAVSVVALFFFGGNLFAPYGNAVTITLSGAALILSMLAGVLFFYLAVPFVVLRLVAGWSTLVGSIAVMLLGLAIASTIVEVDLISKAL